VIFDKEFIAFWARHLSVPFGLLHVLLGTGGDGEIRMGIQNGMEMAINLEITVKNEN